MDIAIPVMDGYKATKLIRALDDEKKRNIPIIAMSANAFADNIQKSRDVGMNMHIAKPVNTVELLQVLSKYQKN